MSDSQHRTKVPTAPVARPKPGATGQVVIDLGQIGENWRALARLVAPSHCGAVVKADAYGLGAARVIPALLGAGCSTFFIATPDEAEEARSLAPQARVLALDGLVPGAAEIFARVNVVPVLSTFADIEEWIRLGKKTGTRLPAAMHIDTGLNRLGLPASEVRRFAGDSRLRNSLDLKLIVSHLACADNPADAKNRIQLLAFETLSALFPGVARSLAASDGLMLGQGYHFDLVRPGYALYGGQANAAAPAPVLPVLMVTARILAVNAVARGESVGYSATWKAGRPSRIATIAAGYADGLPRSASSNGDRARTQVLINGWRAPIVGRVSMDLITADITDLPEDAVGAGDEAMLLGPGLSIEEAGHEAGTIGYEMLTRLGRRFERVYRGS